jgi:hypothetical protein
MLYSALVILASLAVALIGIYIPGPKRWTKIILAGCAVIVALGGIVKVFLDEVDKKRLDDFIQNNFRPSPDTIGTINTEVTRIAKEKGYHSSVAYYEAADGLSFFLDGGPQTGAIVFNKSDLGRIVANGATRESSRLIKDQASRDYGMKDPSYDEDVYSRVAILCSGVVEQTKRTSRIDPFWDANYGVRIDFVVAGKPACVIVSSDQTKLRRCRGRLGLLILGVYWTFVERGLIRRRVTARMG